MLRYSVHFDSLWWGAVLNAARQIKSVVSGVKQEENLERLQIPAVDKSPGISYKRQIAFLKVSL